MSIRCSPRSPHSGRLSRPLFRVRRPHSVLPSPAQFCLPGMVTILSSLGSTLLHWELPSDGIAAVRAARDSFAADPVLFACPRPYPSLPPLDSWSWTPLAPEALDLP